LVLADQARRLAAGKGWHESGYVFTRPDGSPIHPGYASTRFRLLVGRTDLPPIRLHDLRHGAASLAHEAGADLKTLQDLLGHSSIVVTADTYTSVLPLAQRRCADATANLVLNAARRSRNKLKITARRNRPGNPRGKVVPTPTGLTKAKKPQVNATAPDSPSGSGSSGCAPARPAPPPCSNSPPNCPPRSWPGCWASTSASRSPGNAPAAATGPATPPKSADVPDEEPP
jgi:hypothetical protein